MLGTNAINNYAPQIFRNLGIEGHSTGLFATGIYGVVKCVTCSIFLLFLADSFGRRRSLLLSSVGQTCCMFIIGFYVRFDPPLKGEDVPPVGYFALVCIFLFAAFFQFGWGPACWILVSEIPTNRLRGLNVSIAAATQWLFNFVVSRAVPNMLVSQPLRFLLNTLTSATGNRRCSWLWHVHDFRIILCCHVLLRLVLHS